MKILIIGSGAREHAFAWKLSQSRKVTEIFCVPGNPGIAEFAECVNINIDDIDSMLEFAKEKEIDFTVPLEERVIANGICDLFRANDLQIFGPLQDAAKIATNRAFAKKFLFKNKIPTPKYGLFDKENAALDYARKAKFPLVIKYDTPNSFVEDTLYCETFVQAKKFIQKSFANLNKTAVIEEDFQGYEVTFSIITDGYNAVPLPYCYIYKRALDGDGGPITNGVGAFAPVRKIDEKLENLIAQQIVFPTLDALKAQEVGYEGFLSVSVIFNERYEVKAVEFSPTLRDPEAQTILPLIEDDLFDVIFSTSIGALGDDYEFVATNDLTSVSVYLMSGNYLTEPKKNVVIEGIEDLDDDNLMLFYGDTAMNSYYELVTNGRRVLCLTATASTLNNAYDNVYENIDMISFEGMRYRKDIGDAFLANKRIFL